MNITRIQTTLQALFQDESRWAHPGQRVVFWYDPDQQFQDTFAELQLEDVEKLQLDDTPFTIKYRLLIQQPHQAFLLYAPFPQPAPQDNWLLDIQYRGLTFCADRAALIFADLGLRDRSLESVIRQYLKFFDSRKRTEALQTMLLPQTQEQGLLLAMLSVLVGLKVPDAGSLIRRVLMAGLLETDNPLWTDITRLVSPQAFWQTVQDHLSAADATPSLNKLFVRLLNDPAFIEYREVFSRFGFGERTQALLLSQIYPIENYLGPDGKPEVKIRRGRKSGKPTKRPLSSRRFQKALGVAPSLESSGDDHRALVVGGSDLCRMALWQWVFTRLEPARCRLKNEIGEFLGDLIDEEKANGRPVRLVRSRISAEAARLLFRALTDGIDAALLYCQKAPIWRAEKKTKTRSKHKTQLSNSDQSHKLYTSGF